MEYRLRHDSNASSTSNLNYRGDRDRDGVEDRRREKFGPGRPVGRYRGIHMKWRFNNDMNIGVFRLCP